MAALQSGAVESLRILVYIDLFSSEEKDVIRSYLTIALQLRYPRKQVIVDLYCSTQSFALVERLNGISQQVKYLSENNAQPYDWFIPLLFIAHGISPDEKQPNYPWPVYSQKVADAAHTVASHTLLTTIPHSGSGNSAFLEEFNNWILKLDTADGRYLLDLDAILSCARPSTRIWSITCDNIASFITQQETDWDASEEDVSESLFAQIGDIDPQTGHTMPTFKTPVVQTRKYYYHRYTETQLGYWRRELDKRCVLHLQNNQNVQPKAKRTQSPKIKITRPDRVTAESYKSPRNSKYSEVELNKENSPANTRGAFSGPSPGGASSSLREGSSIQDATGMVAAPRLNSRESSNAHHSGRILNPLNPNNTRIRDSAEPGPFIGVGCISPDAQSYASQPSSENVARKRFVMPPDGNHPVWQKSYTTYKSPRERHKAGKVVKLRYTSKPKPHPSASGNEPRDRGSSIDLDRSSVLGQEERNSSPNTSSEDEDVVKVNAHAPPRGSSNAGQHVLDGNGRVYIDPPQRQVLDAVLLPSVQAGGRLSNFPRIDAELYADPFDLDSMADIPDWIFHPDTTMDDVIHSLQDDMDPRLFAELTETINPAVLGEMTNEDVLNAHLPVLEGYQALYPGMFQQPNPLVQHLDDAPLPPPVLQVNGKRMRRDSVPNPLKIWASHPSEYQNPYTAARMGEVEPPNSSQTSSRGTDLPPRAASPASAASGALIPPSASHLPSPVSAGFLAYMADDLRTVRSTPEPANNTARILHSMSETPPGTPGVQGLAKDSPFPQAAAGPIPRFKSVPASMRKDWLRDIERNVRAGNCSFCGLPKDDPKCGHIITNRVGTNKEQPNLEADSTAVRARLARQDAGASAEFHDDNDVHSVAAEQLQQEDAIARARAQSSLVEAVEGQQLQTDAAPTLNRHNHAANTPISYGTMIMQSIEAPENGQGAGDGLLKPQRGRPRKARDADGRIIRGVTAESTSTGAEESGQDERSQDFQSLQAPTQDQPMMPLQKKLRTVPPKQVYAAPDSSMDQPRGIAATLPANFPDEGRSMASAQTAAALYANDYTTFLASHAQQHAQASFVPEAARDAYGPANVAYESPYPGFYAPGHGQLQQQAPVTPDAYRAAAIAAGISYPSFNAQLSGELQGQLPVIPDAVKYANETLESLRASDAPNPHFGVQGVTPAGTHRQALLPQSQGFTATEYHRHEILGASQTQSQAQVQNVSAPSAVDAAMMEAHRAFGVPPKSPLKFVMMEAQLAYGAPLAAARASMSPMSSRASTPVPGASAGAKRKRTLVSASRTPTPQPGPSRASSAGNSEQRDTAGDAMDGQPPSKTKAKTSKQTRTDLEARMTALESTFFSIAQSRGVSVPYIAPLAQNLGQLQSVPQTGMTIPVPGSGSGSGSTAKVFNAFIDQSAGTGSSNQAVSEARKRQRLEKVLAKIDAEDETAAYGPALGAGGGGAQRENDMGMHQPAAKVMKPRRKSQKSSSSEDAVVKEKAKLSDLAAESAQVQMASRAMMSGGLMQTQTPTPAPAFEYYNGSGELGAGGQNSGPTAQRSCKYCAFQEVQCHHDLLKE